MTSVAVFAVQNETGTVTQVTLLSSPSPSLPHSIAIGDTGVYEGYPDDGMALSDPPQFQSLAFTVTSVLDQARFCVGTTNANMADWPANGQITWTGGANSGDTSIVVGIDGANAYIYVSEFEKYCLSRGYTIPATATDQTIQQAIVQATDYLDHRYNYAGIKLLQSIGNAAIDANMIFLETWLTPYALQGVSYLTPTTTTQTTEWPRQGVTDFNGDSVFGIPKEVKFACAELALRVLGGTNLQPDFDPNVVANGAVVQSTTKKAGPLEIVTTYDTKFGLGFFASFPVVDRLLKSAGLLKAGGSRTVIR